MEDDHIPVRVGSGRKAHLFAPHSDADMKAHTLNDGGSVYDYVLCGTGGELVMDVDLPRCKTCERVAAGD